MEYEAGSIHCTDIKQLEKLLLVYKGSGSKLYNEEGVSDIFMRKCGNIKSFLRNPVAKYDFAPAPFQIFSLLFNSVISFVYNLTSTAKSLLTCNPPPPPSVTDNWEEDPSLLPFTMARNIVIKNLLANARRV